MSNDSTSAVRTLARVSRMLERACDGITLTQYRVLALVATGGKRAGRLAEGLALAKPTITAAVDGLVERKLIRRDPDPSDRRAHRLTLTGAGTKVLADTEARMAQRLESVLARVAEPARVVLALRDIGNALDQLLEDRTTVARR